MRRSFEIYYSWTCAERYIMIESIITPTSRLFNQVIDVNSNMALREQPDIPSEEQMLQQQAEQAEMKERRDNLLSQILEPEAKTR